MLGPVLFELGGTWFHGVPGKPLGVDHDLPVDRDQSLILRDPHQEGVKVEVERVVVLQILGGHLVEAVGEVNQR